MPTYRYRCSTCGEELEVWQSFSEEPLKVHDECGGELRKVLSPAGIVLKGSGFYKTDNRTGSNGGSRSKSSESTGGSSSEKSSSSSDSGSGSSTKESSSSSGSGSSGSGSSGSGSGSSGSGSSTSSS